MFDDLHSFSRRRVMKLAAAAVVGGPAFSVSAQTYPSRPVRLIVGYPPGGGADTIARALAGPLGTRLGQPVVVENRAGAAGSIAAASVTKSPADGYTLLIADRGMLVFNLGLFKQITYDPRTELQPLGTIATSSFVLISRTQSDYRTFKQLVAHAQKEPGRLNYAATATGSTAGMEFLKQKAKLDIVRIPYKGVGPAIAAILGGEVDLMLADVMSALPHIRAGKVIPLGVSSLKRSPLLPEVPTIAESGLSGFESMTWIGLVGPRGIPAEIASQIDSALQASLGSGEVASRLEQAGMEPWMSDGAALGKLMAEEQAYWPEQLRSWGLSAP